MTPGQTVYANLQPWNSQDRYSTEFVVVYVHRDGAIDALPIRQYVNDEERPLRDERLCRSYSYDEERI